MKYETQFVKRVVSTLLERKCSAREAERLLGVPRKTLARWLKRTLGALPIWFSRAAKRVRNRTPKNVLSQIRALLKKGVSAVLVWIKFREQVCLRTVQRWKKKWFSPVKAVKEKGKRYQRRKIGSLAHTDWATKRIKNGKRCCFTFWIDDATRRLYALRAYKKADQVNTFDALQRARRTERFKAVLSDCGRVYTKQWKAKCKRFGMKAIHTRPYNPKCNGKAEAVVKKVKRFLRGYVVRDVSHANQLLARFERAYNRTPHGSLKYQTPLQLYRIKQTAGDIWAVA